MIGVRYNVTSEIVSASVSSKLFNVALMIIIEQRRRQRNILHLSQSIAVNCALSANDVEDVIEEYCLLIKSSLQNDTESTTAK